MAENAPVTADSILDDLKHRFEVAKDNAKETGKIAPGSWGAGYDLGYSDALGELVESLISAGVVGSVRHD